MDKLPENPSVSPLDEDEIPIEQDPDAPELEKYWQDIGREMLRDSIKTLDETARQVIGVAGIVEGLYFHAIAYSDLRWTALNAAEQAIYLAPVALLLISLVFALLAFWPERHPYDLCSWESARRIYEQVKRDKLRAVRRAAVFLILGIFALLAALFLYLG